MSRELRLITLTFDMPEVGTFGEMLRMVGKDPVGTAMADDLMFRLFQANLLGIGEASRRRHRCYSLPAACHAGRKADWLARLHATHNVSFVSTWH